MGCDLNMIGCLTADTCNQAPGITKTRNNENEDEAQEHKSKAIRNKIQRRVKSEWDKRIKYKSE